MLSTDTKYSALQLVFLLFVSTRITRENETELNSTPGDSVWFPGIGEDQKSQAEVFQWKKASGSVMNRIRMEPLLQFHVGAKEPALIQNYIGRIDFSRFNGSFALRNLTRADEGRYQLFINLQEVAVRTVWLNIMEKLSGLSVRSNSSSLGSAVQLTCDVVGDPQEYSWQKDGGEISRHHQLTNGSRNLIIPRASSIDCGRYTCVATNTVSSVQGDYTLTIYGIPSKEIVIIMILMTGLVFSGVSLIGSAAFHSILCESMQESQRKLSTFVLWLYFWNMPSLFLIQIALTFWFIKGAVTRPTIFLYIVSFLLLILSALMDIPKLRHPCVQNVMEKMGLLIVRDFSGIVVILISIIILKEKFWHMNKSCHSRTLSWGTLLISMVVSAAIYSVYFVVRYYRNKPQESSTLKKQENEELETIVAHHTAEPKSPQLV